MTSGVDGINTFWWRKPGLTATLPNFGDELTTQLAQRLFNRTCIRTPARRADLIGSGSIVEMAQIGRAKPGLKVWGSGFMADRQPRKDLSFPDFDCYAVRGKLTRDRIRADRDVALGDPGLLASRAYPRSTTIPGKIGLVYHYVNKNDSAVRDAGRHGVTLIDPLRAPDAVTADITSCEFVFSSSLHGLIVADSYGIPNAWVTFKRKLGGGSYKFDDYYSAFDGAATMTSPDSVTDVAEIRRLERTYRGIPDLEAIQNRLIAAFPYSPSTAAGRTRTARATT